MFHSLSDEEFCNKVHNVLHESIRKEADFQLKIEKHFNKSFPMIRQRYKRVAKKTLNSAHEMIRYEYAKEALKHSSCFEVMSDLGFKYESNFAKWFRKYSGMNPSEFSAMHKRNC